MMESPPTHKSSTVELSTGKDSSKSDCLSDRFVTGNSDLDYWIWIIEYFAKFKSELWILHDVFEMGPKLPDYLGVYTNEMVALRCLASLFDSPTSVQSKDAVSDAKVEFDSSESCEYVLQCILDEIPLSELKPGATGLSKWNLLPFIKSKLLCVPKCALELMIEPSCEQDNEVLSPCKGQETTRSDDKETDHVTPRTVDPELTGRREDRPSFCDGPEDGVDEIIRSDELLERRNEGSQNKSDDHVSSDSNPWENRYRCIKCKESGKLLFCSGDGCTIMIHENCVDVNSSPPPTYDAAGDFYCSLCAFNCDSAEYLKAKDEVAKAKRKLVSFLSLMSMVNKKKSMEGSSCRDPSTLV